MAAWCPWATRGQRRSGEAASFAWVRGAGQPGLVLRRGGLQGALSGTGRTLLRSPEGPRCTTLDSSPSEKLRRRLFRLSGCYTGLRTRGPRDLGFVPTLRRRGFDQYCAVRIWSLLHKRGKQAELDGSWGSDSPLSIFYQLGQLYHCYAEML